MLAALLCFSIVFYSCPARTFLCAGRGAGGGSPSSPGGKRNCISCDLRVVDVRNNASRVKQIQDSSKYHRLYIPYLSGAKH